MKSAVSSVAGRPVWLSLSPLPAHVRTARLVAVATARQLGVREELLDEVRLAVGEACTRAVAAHQRAGIDDLIEVRFGVDEGFFAASVRDLASSVSSGGGSANALELLGSSDEFTEGFAEGLMENTAAVELALISQLVHSLDVAALPGGGTQLTMWWPL